MNEETQREKCDCRCRWRFNNGFQLKGEDEVEGEEEEDGERGREIDAKGGEG